MCSMLEKECPECKGTGKMRGVTFLGEPPKCEFCNGTGCVPKNQIYISY